MRASRRNGRWWRLAILGTAVCAGCRPDVRGPATRGADAVDALAQPLAASPAPPPPHGAAAVSGLTAVERRGQAVYGAYCWSCHGLYGHGDGPGARGLAGEVPDLERIASVASAKEMIRRLRRGAGARTDSGPPAWHDLEPGEIAAAVAYVATFAPHSRGNPSAGRLIYESYCERCHGTRGAGDGRLASTLSPPPADLRALDLAHRSRQVFEMLRAGGEARHGGLMPGWGSAFGDRQLWDVMAYLRVLAASR